MKICLFEQNKNPYPVKGYGGERINQLLYKTLVDLGYDTTLITMEESTISYKNGKVIKLPFDTICKIRYGQVKLKDYLPEEYDIFHTWTSGKNQSIDFDGVSAEWTATCLGDHEHSQCKNQSWVSYSQYKQHISEFNVNETCKNKYVCHVGVDENALQYIENNNRKDIVWLGNICPAKGAHIAGYIGECIGQKIIIAGNISDESYYQQHVKPYIGRSLEYVGEIRTEEEKVKFFSNAKYYLHLCLANEPFGLTNAEAQMCGVPILSINRGSAKEVNYNSLFVSETISDINKKLILDIGQFIDRKELRDWTVKNFSSIPMTNRFIKMWEDVLKRKYEH